MRKTEIAPWTKSWFDLYHDEAALLKSIFSNEIVDIHHIGSTSVPQVGFAKPIIDILIIVQEIFKVDDCNEEMILEGYKPRGEQGICGRRYFSKGGDQRTLKKVEEARGKVRTWPFPELPARYLFQQGNTLL